MDKLQWTKFGYCNNIIKFEDLLSNIDTKLFYKIQSRSHCLFPLLPTIRENPNRLRHRGHPYTLPQCNTDLHKKSFLIRCLFNNL